MEVNLILPANFRFVTIQRNNTGKPPDFRHYKTKRPDMNASGRCALGPLTSGSIDQNPVNHAVLGCLIGRHEIISIRILADLFHASAGFFCQNLIQTLT